MKIEIWSDVMCPFCYIGKRKFENALAKFERKEQVVLEWKSFELNPQLKTDTSISIHQYLAAIKGWTLEYSKKMHAQVTQMAADVGLQYNFDKVVVANSFNAHRLVQLAKKYDKDGQIEEALFHSYFTEGKNIDDAQTLMQIGTGAGLDAILVKQMLESDAFSKEVKADEEESYRIGVRGVPFFLKDRRIALSGAQPEEVFLSFLRQ